MRSQSSLLVTLAPQSSADPSETSTCKPSHGFYSEALRGRGGEASGRLAGEASEPKAGAGFEEGAHDSALAPLQGLQRRAPSRLHHLFPRLMRESQELNPRGFGCLGHRNATWVKCLLPAFQLEGSTPFLELLEPLVCAPASKTPW